LVEDVTQNIRRSIKMCARHTTLRLYHLTYKITRGYSAKPTKVSGLFGPRYSIATDPARYVAQVQTGPVLKNPIRTVARDTIGPLWGCFTEENGEVNATRFL